METPEERDRRIRAEYRTLLSPRETRGLETLFQALRELKDIEPAKRALFCLPTELLQMNEESVMRIFRIFPSRSRHILRILYWKEIMRLSLEPPLIFGDLGIILGTTSPVDLGIQEQEMWRYHCRAEAPRDLSQVTVIHRRWKWTLGKEECLLTDLYCTSLGVESGRIFLDGLPIYRNEGGVLTLCPESRLLAENSELLSRIPQALLFFQGYRYSRLHPSSSRGQKRKVQE